MEGGRKIVRGSNLLVLMVLTNIDGLLAIAVSFCYCVVL